MFLCGLTTNCRNVRMFRNFIPEFFAKVLQLGQQGLHPSAISDPVWEGIGENAKVASDFFDRFLIRKGTYL